MPETDTQQQAFTLELSGEERALLLNILSRDLRDKQVEEHRTDSIEYRDYVRHEEELLQGILDKLQRT